MNIDVTYAGGSESYLIPFPYLEKSFVKVEVNEKPWTLSIDYEVTDSYVKLLRPTQETDTVYIYRKTTTDRLVKFHDGSVLREADLTRLQLQLLHVIEEQGTFTVTEMTQNLKQLQLERQVKLADGLEVTRGTVLGYKAGGFVKADLNDYTTLQDVVIALSDSKNGKVQVLEQGEFAINDIPDGMTVFVGADGAYRGTIPNVSGNFIKVLGTVEDDVLIFHPDTLAIQLA